MAYFLPYGKWLAERWNALANEMRYRGFVVNLTWRQYPEALAQWMPERHEELARQILIQRINERLSGMEKSTWTTRAKPKWVAD